MAQVLIMFLIRRLKCHFCFTSKTNFITIVFKKSLPKQTKGSLFSISTLTERCFAKHSVGLTVSNYKIPYVLKPKRKMYCKVNHSIVPL